MGNSGESGIPLGVRGKQRWVAGTQVVFEEYLAHVGWVDSEVQCPVGWQVPRTPQRGFDVEASSPVALWAPWPWLHKSQNSGVRLAMQTTFAIGSDDSL